MSIVGALNRAYDIDEGRPWWKVRVVAIGLTLGVALIVVIALLLVLVGPTLAAKLGQTTGWGAPFEWTCGHGDQGEELPRARDGRGVNRCPAGPRRVGYDRSHSTGWNPSKTTV